LKYIIKETTLDMIKIVKEFAKKLADNKKIEGKAFYIDAFKLHFNL